MTSAPLSPPPARAPRPSWFRRRSALGLLAALALLATFTVIRFRPSASANTDHLTFTARRGPLDISVIEGGSVQALESQEIKCEVRVGYQGLKILRIVEEGYLVTDNDIRTNKVLVELDSSELQKQITQQEIQYQSAAASLTEAKQGYEIQLNQNLSDLRAAEQKVRFARMDFEKFLGATVADQIIAQLKLDTETQAPLAPQPAPGPSPSPSSTTNLQVFPAVSTVPPSSIAFDFTPFANLDALGDGEAKQKIRELEDTLQVARKEEGQAQSTLEGTRRLFDREFLTKTDLERDEIAYENAHLKVQKAATARELYLKYEFRKAAEEWLSKYAEAVRELDRARKAAISKLAQAEARWKSAEAQFEVQARQRTENQEQLAKCTITAQKTGLVVYGGGGEDNVFYGGEERIREGATVRERQSIITIPDMNRMGVKVKIHESYIKKIRKGQKARLTVEAFPDEQLDGEVTAVGLLPDSANRWMNPDLKVYLTTITIQGTRAWLKPGMSAKAIILVDHLPEVVQIPLQAVFPMDNRQACRVLNARAPELRFVETGQFNDEFIEIRSGLNVGEAVLLSPQRTPPAKSTPAAPTPTPPAPTPAPAAATAPPSPA